MQDPPFSPAAFEPRLFVPRWNCPNRWKGRKASTTAGSKSRPPLRLADLQAGLALRFPGLLLLLAPRGNKTARLRFIVVGATIRRMSRLRRLLISDKIFFITCNVLQSRLPFIDADFVCHADAIRGVRTRRNFLFTGFVFMPDHWHALVAPDHGDTLPNMVDAVKVAGTRRVNARRGLRGPLWQPRYYDEIIGTVKQYHETLDYMHFNPVRRGLVLKPDDWPWSSFRSYGGSGDVPLEVDRLNLPADRSTRMG
jgi:REP element-mobilizing transposase RayT